MLGTIRTQDRTEECRFGFLGEDGRHYGIDYDKEHGEFWATAEGSGQFLIISGEITMPPEAFPSGEFDRYDIVGVIAVTSASSIAR